MFFGECKLKQRMLEVDPGIQAADRRSIEGRGMNARPGLLNEVRLVAGRQLKEITWQNLAQTIFPLTDLEEWQ